MSEIVLSSKVYEALVKAGRSVIQQAEACNPRDEIGHPFANNQSLHDLRVALDAAEADIMDGGDYLSDKGERGDREGPDYGDLD